MDVVAQNVAIGTYGRERRWAKALDCFHELRGRLWGMENEGKRWFFHRFSLISGDVPRCSSVSAWFRMPGRRLEGTDITQTALLHALSSSLRWAAAAEAVAVLGRGGFRSNIISLGAAVAGPWCQQLLWQLRHRSLEPNAVCYGSGVAGSGWPQGLQLLREAHERRAASLVGYNACAAAAAWPLAWALLAEALPKGWRWSHVSRGTQAACGPWPQALRTLRGSRNVVAYGGLVARAPWRTALGLTRQLEEHAVEVNVQIYSSCASRLLAKASEKGREWSRTPSKT